MTQENEHLVLELLRAIGSDISGIKQDIREMKGQLIAIRQQAFLRSLRRHRR